MTRRIKYIRTKTCFIVFSEPLQHNQIKTGDDIMSAGFCFYEKDYKIWVCFGKSISLGLDSLPEDSDLLTIQMNEQWS